MPYKDKEKYKITRKKWVKNNKEKIYKNQKRYQQKHFIEQYSPLVQEIQHYNIKEKAIRLRPIHGAQRKKIYKYFIIPFSDQIEQEIQRIIWRSKEQKKYYSYKKENKKKNDKIKFIQKYSPLVQKIQSYSISDKAENLYNIHGQIRDRIYNYFIIPFSDQIEEKITKTQNRTYYLNNKPKNKKRMNGQWEFIKKWMTDRGCDCGEKEITKLSFHHLNPSEKESTIRKMLGSSMKRIKAELKKGVVKCKNCHTIVHVGTSEEREESLINQYLKYPISKKTIYRNKLLIWEFKKTLSCIKCGIDDPVILLFHHIDSKDKHKKISILYKAGRDIINKEINKTACLCHNCHENFHYLIGYHVPTNHQQLEQYIEKKVIPLRANIKNYLPTINQNISEFYNLPFLIP